jgi:tRNA nucleotidyltransferase/poly(A) polymerase
MNFKRFLNEEEISKKRWQEYLTTNSMLEGGVDVLRLITKHGYKAYLVGGAVRDIVLGKNPHDIDIATNMPISELQKTFPKNYDIGKSKDFGIFVVKHKGHTYEIAQFRQDGTYLDGRRPEEVTIIQDFKTDAGRRDFTMNAMAVDKDGNIIDYFDGQKDIKDKVIRTVGNPHDRFKEDNLRMLRAVRFSSKLGYDIHHETKEAIKSNKEGIKKVSGERIREELMKMAAQTGSKFADAIKTLDEVGILKIILPEIVKMKEYEHSAKNHPEGGVWEHTMEALRQNKITNPIVNLSILLHDVGKIKGTWIKKKVR